MADNLNNAEDAIGQIKKLAGKSYSEPKKLKSSMATTSKAYQDSLKAFGEFKKQRDVMEKILLDLENGISKVKNALKQAESELSDETFGIDDAKVASQAQTLLSKGFADDKDYCDFITDKLDELDKHLQHVYKYKVPS